MTRKTLLLLLVLAAVLAWCLLPPFWPRLIASAVLAYGAITVVLLSFFEGSHYRNTPRGAANLPRPLANGGAE